MWQTPQRTYHPALHNEGVEYVLGQLIKARRIVHQVLSLPEFGWAEHIQRSYVPPMELYPGTERFTRSGLVLVMTKRWPLEIQHPFGCQQFDGGYYYEDATMPERADQVVARLVEHGLLLTPLQPPPVSASGKGVPLGCSFYAIDEVKGATGQVVTFDTRVWADQCLSGLRIVEHYQSAMQRLDVAG